MENYKEKLMQILENEWDDKDTLFELYGKTFELLRHFNDTCYVYYGLLIKNILQDDNTVVAGEIDIEMSYDDFIFNDVFMTRSRKKINKIISELIYNNLLVRKSVKEYTVKSPASAMMANMGFQFHKLEEEENDWE